MIVTRLLSFIVPKLFTLKKALFHLFFKKYIFLVFLYSDLSVVNCFRSDLATTVPIETLKRKTLLPRYCSGDTWKEMLWYRRSSRHYAVKRLQQNMSCIAT
mmetsp:Transcript_297/g.659  ORF Transcript_297/g.659 Transcript_297/m.659 type:complete len:101 (-) Transcript_297:205-507(-)